MYAALLFAVGLATPARAQFSLRPLGDEVTGELYRIEASFGFWSPAADMLISSESLGIAGTRIDFKNDLGLTDRRFPELHLVLRPGTKHKLRFQYIPISYAQDTVAERDIVFNGQRYRIGVPVNSSLDWGAYRFGYEYDFLVRDRWFTGVVLDFKYTDVNATLATPLFEEFAHAQAPIPAVGGIFRMYVVPNISVTGEVTGFKLPKNLVEDAAAHYVDVDLYGTVNFNRHLGAQIGYRSFDLGYVVDEDLGNFKLKGLYFGVVARY